MKDAETDSERRGQREGGDGGVEKRCGDVLRMEGVPRQRERGVESGEM